MQETCHACDISPNTYYNIRNRLFYGMQLMMEKVKLFDVISCDITFVRANFKGSDLNIADYPEDSPFFVSDFKPRSARSRGSSNKMAEKSQNTVAIFTAIDSHNHVFVRYLNLGSASAKTILDCVGDKFLVEIPESDPSPFHNKNYEKTDKNQSPKISLLVSDKEKAIMKFASLYGIPHECHVYQRNGVQLRLAKNSNHIQTVNHLHSKLKKFLRDANYVSSKYLPGFLILFEFVQNTKCSEEAINQLFRTLSQPGLLEMPAVINEQFVIPNYLKQYLDSSNPCKHLKQNQIKAYCLYRKRAEDIANGSSTYQSVDEIAKICDMSPSSVRRNFKNLEASGFGPEIMKLHDNGKGFRKQAARKAFAPDILALYDEYQKNLQLPRDNRKNLAAFLRDMSNKHQKIYDYDIISEYFRQIKKSGIRDK